MSFPDAHFTRFSKSPLAYKQYAPDDPVQNSIFDSNFDCDASLRYQKRIKLLVDSRDRDNPTRYPPNKYSMKLNKIYKDVIKIELIHSNFPNSNYIINENNNCFYIQDNQDQVDQTCGIPYHKITLPIGDYPADATAPTISIRSLLEDELNAIDGANTYTVTVNPNTRTFTFEQTAGSGIFNILFNRPNCSNSPEEETKTSLLPNTMSILLGFPPVNQTDLTSYTSPYAYHLISTDYLILKINPQTNGWQVLDSNRDAAQNAFAIIPIDASNLNNFSGSRDMCDLDNEQYTLHFNPPIPTLDRLNIEITDQHGNPFNFRGRNHNMTFEITSLSQHSTYSHGSAQTNKISL